MTMLGNNTYNISNHMIEHGIQEMNSMKNGQQRSPFFSQNVMLWHVWNCETY